MKAPARLGASVYTSLPSAYKHRYLRGLVVSRQLVSNPVVGI